MSNRYEPRVTALFTFIFLVCLSLTHCETEDKELMFCVSGVSNRHCYTIYRNRLLSESDAAEVCRQQQGNGRLVSVFDNMTQMYLQAHLDVAPNNGYWLGARLMLLDDWTWLNNSRFTETSMFKLPDRHSRGYMTIARWSNHYFKLNSISVNDPPENNITLALCKCTKTDVRDCVGGKRYSTHRWVRSWHDARSKCTQFSQTDLAVLSEDDVRFYESELFHFVPYYIGLRNVRLVWNPADLGKEATYVNWADDLPSYYINDTVKHLCVYAAPVNGKWRTESCDRKMAFICENATTENITTTSTTTTTMITSSMRTPAASPVAESANAGLSIGLSLSIVLVIAVVTIAGVIFYFRRKLLMERQRSSDHQTYSSIDERHLTAIEEASAYSYVSTGLQPIQVTVNSAGWSDSSYQQLLRNDQNEQENGSNYVALRHTANYSAYAESSDTSEQRHLHGQAANCHQYMDVRSSYENA